MTRGRTRTTTRRHNPRRITKIIRRQPKIMVKVTRVGSPKPATRRVKKKKV